MSISKRNNASGADAPSTEHLPDEEECVDDPDSQARTTMFTTDLFSDLEDVDAATAVLEDVPAPDESFLSEDSPISADNDSAADSEEEVDDEDSQVRTTLFQSSAFGAPHEAMLTPAVDAEQSVAPTARPSAGPVESGNERDPDTEDVDDPDSQVRTTLFHAPVFSEEEGDLLAPEVDTGHLDETGSSVPDGTVEGGEESDPDTEDVDDPDSQVKTTLFRPLSFSEDDPEAPAWLLEDGAARDGTREGSAGDAVSQPRSLLPVVLWIVLGTVVLSLMAGLGGGVVLLILSTR